MLISQFPYFGILIEEIIDEKRLFGLQILVFGGAKKFVFGTVRNHGIEAIANDESVNCTTCRIILERAVFGSRKIRFFVDIENASRFAPFHTTGLAEWSGRNQFAQNKFRYYSGRLLCHSIVRIRQHRVE